uniref:CUE domain-containing protein n=1 Tax=Globisporangium ultimum (strain ATCC 200006 / CBS 805.95 / DAOM BR144) TaxID=431595 RepID=K3X5M3_GLOUD
MALVAALDACLRSADAAFLAQTDAQLMPLLDAFFSHATRLQAHRDQLKALPKDAHDALDTEARLVFLLYMRVFALLKKQQSDKTLLDSLMHMTRIVPFCQLYAQNNGPTVQAFVDELVDRVDGFDTHVGKLHDVYLTHLQHVHAAVQQDKRTQVLDLIHSIYEISLSLRGLFTSKSLSSLLLLNNGKDPEQIVQSESLLRALVVCYESDLPMLQRHLVKLDEKVLGRFMDLLMTKQDEGNPDEVLLEVLHIISHCCEDDNAEQGSYLSDLWHLCDYKTKISSFLESGEVESDHLSYLEMIADGLPRRRIVPVGMDSEKKLGTEKPSHDLAQAKGHAEASVHYEEEEKEDYNHGEDAALLTSMVHQVKDFFPDLGDGYVELCLLSSQKQLEVVINFLLESNPPPALLDVPRDLSRSDPTFSLLEAQLTGKPPAPAKASKAKSDEQKLDPTRVWVGKKPQEKHYDPQIAKKDADLVNKTKKIADMIVEEEEIMAGMVPFLKLDEYDDDYNDEFEDYEPFSVHDSGLGDNQDSIRKHNRLLLAREAEDAFWESMKNKNHQYAANNDDEEDDDDEEEKVNASNTAKASFRPPTGQQTTQKQQPMPTRNPQQKQNPANKKNAAATPKNNGQKALTAADSAGTPPMTKEQELRARARNAKNKAKVGNHNRKDRALKKQG